MRNVPTSGESRGCGFQRVLEAFLLVPGLPFPSVLDAERIEAVFRKHGGLFGPGGISHTAVMVWSFLGQVLRDGKEASCRAAVARIAVWKLQHGALPPTPDTGDYCRARAKLPGQALREVIADVAQNMEEQAGPQWLWEGRHAKLIDGSTFSMPNTVNAATGATHRSFRARWDSVGGLQVNHSNVNCESKGPNSASTSRWAIVAQRQLTTSSGGCARALGRGSVWRASGCGRGG